ncbi:MAG: ATP-binding cassette domain-containing protein, partial [Pseudomonadota bacterium]|nr:ATP-binding cassette domain-containing protein [Pseudomonadota bacterium]
SFISRIPGGMDAILTDRGKSLSAGQRQAISIARALVNDPDLLIMDEPTASLDLNAEQAFVKKLNGFLNEKTLIAVTHRIPLLELVDRIIVIADGKVALDGPRDHVLDQLGAKKS